MILRGIKAEMDVDKDESRDVEVEPKIEVVITVLAKGDTFVYTVPKFSGLQANFAASETAIRGI